MRERRFSRRDVLKSSAAVVGGLFASAARAAALEPTAITPSLVAEARKEGRLFYYTPSTYHWQRRLRNRSRAPFPASPSVSSAAAPNACSSASARNTPAASTALMWSIRLTRRILLSVSVMAFLLPSSSQT